MLWYELIVGGLCVLFGLVGWFFLSNDDLSIIGFFASALSVLALGGCILVPVIVYPSRSVGRSTCKNWSEQTGYQTKFTVLNWADQGTCLALAPNGRWVPNTQIIINTPTR